MSNDWHSAAMSRDSWKREYLASARKRADIEADCPMFLSVRMCRALEHVLCLEPSEDPHGYLEEDFWPHKALNTASLADGPAKALTAMAIKNQIAPSYAFHFLKNLVDFGHIRGKMEGPELYRYLLNHMQRELQDSAPSSINWSSDGGLKALRPIEFRAPGALNGSAMERVFVADDSVAPAAMRKSKSGRLPPFFGPEAGRSNASQNGVKRLASPAALPMTKYADEICQLVRRHQVVLIQGETGSGKTTQVPQYILDMAREERIDGTPVRIVVTQPRRLAAVSVARRVCYERGESLGEGIVGSKIRGETIAGRQCQLLFCTTGVLLRRLMSEGQKWMFSTTTVTHLIVDEVHERSSEVDFLLTFLKSMLPLRPNLRVVMMSATLDARVLLRYFATTSESGETVEPPMLSVPGFTHLVCEVYLEKIEDKLGIEKKKPTGKNSSSRVSDMWNNDPMRRNGYDRDEDDKESEGIPYELIAQLITRLTDPASGGPWSFVDEDLPEKPSKTDWNGRDAVLVFLPGIGEITELVELLKSQGPAVNWWVLPLHASLPWHEQQKCFNTEWPEGKNFKIICCTNVAETSITIPDITVVIDSCRERRNQVDRYSNTPCLRENWCALDSLKQRRGRAGRVQPGVCLRLVPLAALDQFEKVTTPEMQRVPLENLYLQVCASGIEDRSGFLACTPDPPDHLAVQFAKSALQDLGALDNDASDGLSPLGRHLAALPCHPRLGKMMILGCLLSCPGPVLSIVSVLSVRNPMLNSIDQAKRDEWGRARTTLMREEGCQRSDHCVWALLIYYWLTSLDVSRQRLLCDHYGLSYERMIQAVMERKHLCESLVSIGMLPQDYLQQEQQALDEQRHMKEAKASWGLNLDWVLVRSAIIGGLYPNIIYVERTVPYKVSRQPLNSSKWLRYSVLQRHYSQKDEMAYPKQLNLHPGSLLFTEDQYHCPWLAYFTCQQTTKLYAYDVSEASPFSLLLFGGPLTINSNTGHIEVGGWVKFACPAAERILPVVDAARSVIQRVLLHKLKDPSWDVAASRELAVCATLLRTNGLGFEMMPPEDAAVAVATPAC